MVNTGSVEALALTLLTAKPKGAEEYFTAYTGVPGVLPAQGMTSRPMLQCASLPSI